MKTKYQSIIISIPSVSPIGTYASQEIPLDTAYPRCTGMMAKIVSNGGVDDIDFSLKDINETHFSQSDISTLIAGDSVPPNHKYLSQDIGIFKGQGLKAEITTAAATTSALKIKVTFRLEK